MGKLKEILSHPGEILPLYHMYKVAKAAEKLPSDPDRAFCFDILNNVSRSFSIVIQQLPQPLKDAICIFYLVLRGLDTVEDDMAYPKDKKVPDLLSFHKKIYDRNFNLNCGYNHYKRLMKNFQRVVNVFLSLDPAFQNVIADITKRMGEGMAEFLEKDVISVADYDLYCHYVAGLVGIGLSQLFAMSNLESDSFGKNEGLSNHMGLFLQKTNIIRDYLEDILEEPAPRMFWPRDVWSRYASTLDEFKAPSHRVGAVRCLNHLILDALRHLPHCVEYMQSLRNTQVFRFCAIPQIMAMGTLSICYNNGKVFEGVVKMRRGLTATVFESCSNMGDLLHWFLLFLTQLQETAETSTASNDPTLSLLQSTVRGHIDLCREALAKYENAHQPPKAVTLAGLVQDTVFSVAAAIYVYAAWNLGAGTAMGGGRVNSASSINNDGKDDGGLLSSSSYHENSFHFLRSVAAKTFPTVTPIFDLETPPKVVALAAELNGGDLQQAALHRILALVLFVFVLSRFALRSRR
mmetsp:Transcript_20164/g.36231  ORF Transcript_20164/g.36231 Transcript_20164/m.36231 type:complete len:519 (-) Transcript_20164:72-1628(-)